MASLHLWALMWIKGARSKAVSKSIPILCSFKGGKGEFDPDVAILQLLWPKPIFVILLRKSLVSYFCLPCNLSCSCRYSKAMSPAVSILFKSCCSLSSTVLPDNGPIGTFSKASACTANDSAMILRLRMGNGFSVSWSSPASERYCRASLYSPVGMKARIK